MKLKQLEIALEDVEVFESPKIHLEQYPTTPHLAACVLYEAQSRYDDIQGRAVADLGCGTGMLAIGAAILGGGYVCGFDVDADALAIAANNVSEFEVDVELVNMDLCHMCVNRPAGVTATPKSSEKVEHEQENKDGSSEVLLSDHLDSTHESFLGSQGTSVPSARDSPTLSARASLPSHGSRDKTMPSVSRGRQMFDTVIMNPPFGTRCKGMDVLFLQRALCIATRAVYSMHKSSTREHLAKKAQQWGVKFEVIAELKFDVPAMYSFHRKDNVVVQVDLIRLGISEKGLETAISQALWLLCLEWEGNTEGAGEDGTETGNAERLQGGCGQDGSGRGGGAKGRAGRGRGRGRGGKSAGRR